MYRVLVSPNVTGADVIEGAILYQPITTPAEEELSVDVDVGVLKRAVLELPPVHLSASSGVTKRLLAAASEGNAVKGPEI